MFNKLICLILLINHQNIFAKNIPKSKPQTVFNHWSENQMIQEYTDEEPENQKFVKETHHLFTGEVVPHGQDAKMARYIVEKSNWCAMATISSRHPIKGYPFVNIFSVSDGPIGNSSGIPYMYVTPLDITLEDLKENNQASLTMTLAQGDYCDKNGYDPEDPRCPHVILTGTFVSINSTGTEHDFAKTALFTRHPKMSSWPNKGHMWYFAKLDISNIIVMDSFGGPKTVSTEEYFNAK